MFRQLLLTYQYSELRYLAPVVAVALVLLLAILLVRAWANRKLAAGRSRCPECGSATVRIHRRTADRLLSLLVPVSRFRCENSVCGWNGLVAQSEFERANLVLTRAAIAVIVFVALDAVMIILGLLLARL